MRDYGLRNKLRASEGTGVGEWYRLVMGSKEGTYCMVHWYYTQLMNFTSKTRDVLYGD